MLSEAEDLYETIMMGLRMTREGVNRARFKRRFGFDIVAMFPEAVESMTAAALLRVTPDRVRI